MGYDCRVRHITRPFILILRGCRQPYASPGIIDDSWDVVVVGATSLTNGPRPASSCSRQTPYEVRPRRMLRSVSTIALRYWQSYKCIRRQRHWHARSGVSKRLSCSLRLLSPALSSRMTVCIKLYAGGQHVGISKKKLSIGFDKTLHRSSPLPIQIFVE